MHHFLEPKTLAIECDRGAVGRILGLNVTDMKCLDVMTMRGSATPSQLAEHTGLSSGAITAMIDRLEKAGLVERPKQAMQKLPVFFRSVTACTR